MSFERDGIQQIDTDELLKLYKESESDYVLLDVRENEEYNDAHIPGVKLIPTSEFVERYEDELDKHKHYLVICRSGNRSHMVCKFLKEQGFENCKNYADGMLGWDGPTETGDLPTNEGNRW